MNLLKHAPAVLVLLAMAPALNGCGRSEASASARDRPGLADGSESRAYARTDRYADGSSRGGDRDGLRYGRRREPVPSFRGEPMWSDSSRHTARENAEYRFQRNGDDLGAKTLDDFLTRVHAFVDHPPAEALHLTRANGDRLIYDPKSNIFAVVRRDGAPRTIFKPTDKMAYWNEQQSRERSDGGRGDYGAGYRARAYGQNDG